jgi:hypothetical protein
MASLVQKAKNLSVTVLPASSTGASGTRGLLEVTVTFDNPVTAHNDIVLSVMGNISTTGADVVFGGILGFLSIAVQGALPMRTYWIGVTFTDAAGRETMLGGVQSIDLQAGWLLRVLRPNREDASGHPGFASWSIYASLSGPTGLGLVAAGLDPETPTPGPPGEIYWQEPDTGITPGGPPPTTPVQDTLGNSYTVCNWVDQFEGGSNTGNNAMGFFLASDSPGGANAIKFVCAGINPNSAFTYDGILSVIACEFTPLGTTQDTDSLKQHSGTGAVSISLTDSSSATRITDWGTRNGNTAMVLDLSPTPGTDSFFAMFCNPLAPLSPDPPTPTLTSGVYTFLDAQTPPVPPSSDNVPHWLWYSSPSGPPPPPLTLDCPVNETATLGAPYSGQLVVGGGVPPYTFTLL